MYTKTPLYVGQKLIGYEYADSDGNPVSEAAFNAMVSGGSIEPCGNQTIRGRAQDLAAGEGIEFISGIHDSNKVRSITVNVLSTPVHITDGNGVVTTMWPVGSFTWAAASNESTNGLLESVSIPAGSSGVAIVQWNEVV